MSYKGDLRGVVEDVLGKTRDVRVSVTSFAHIGRARRGSARHLLWPQATDDDEPCRYVREKIRAVARKVADGRVLTTRDSDPNATAGSR